MPKRKQNTSCGPCRRARIGCDAALRGVEACSNCVRRNKTCTATLRKATRSRGTSGLTSITDIIDVAPSSVLPEEVPSRSLCHESRLYQNHEALALHHYLWDAYTALFEPQFGLWMGNDCCPFKHFPTAPKTLISRLMISLDITRSQQALNQEPRHKASNPADDIIINNALIRAVHAFSARWIVAKLPGHDRLPTIDITRQSHDRISDILWHRARQDMYKLLARVSYRSSLALYLFGITPTRAQNPEAHFSDVCREMSLKQLRELRDADRCPPPRLTTPLSIEDMSPVVDRYSCGSQYHQMVDTAYWFGIVCDTSRCLLTGSASVLFPDRTAHLSVRHILRRQIEGFRSNSEGLCQSKSPLPENTIYKIVCHGSAAKSLCWLAIVPVQRAIICSEADTALDETIGQCIREIEQFESLFSPFLDMFLRDYLLLSRELRVSVYLLTIHFHLGVLVFLNIPTQGSELSGLIPNYLELLLNSTRQIVNVIRMSLCTSGSPHPGNDQTILLDPYPEHVSDSLWYAGRGILTLARERILSLIAVESMLSVVLCGLSHLTKISFSARERLPLLRQLCVASGYEATINNVLPCFSADTSAPSSTSQSAWVDGAERLTNESLCDATLVTNTIYGYDNRVGLNQRALGWASDEVDWSQIDSVLEQWKFSDCFVDMDWWPGE
ncbi:hypothetical protein ASPCAL12863 [Aspergillus calidoustus]|uniref:Zn(2)-C6 fungal-type domain-containing protein n=1 Tax=Aspergillus calidoustus TaxID=454130 RepID=A0A0U4ZJJ6_ASPCI|nr:hypothetical protein ASPCAL12863 [Aspergillus calidoustus]